MRKEKLFVAQLDPKGNAAAAGVRTGDQLVAGGGIDFETVADFNGISEVLEDGDQLEFSIKRGNSDKDLLIVYGTPSDDQSATMLEGSFEANKASEKTASRSMLAPEVNKINTRPNTSFMPNQRNVQTAPNQNFLNSSQQTTGRSGTSRTIRSQQEEIQRLRQQLEQVKGQGISGPAPSLQVPPSAASVMN